MSLTTDERPNEAAVYTYLDQSRSAQAEKTARLTRATAETPDGGWEDIIDELITIGLYQDDWDGTGSIAPDPGAVLGATRLVFALKASTLPSIPADRAIASINGTIFFEWHAESGYQEIEVTSPVDAELRRVAAGSNVAEVIPFNIP